MPCDNNNVERVHVYVDILTEISTICSKYEADSICIGRGDMNTNLTRVDSQHSQVCNQFATKESLQFASNHSSSDISHTYFRFFI